jgi:PAS domain S-box-containing protein
MRPNGNERWAANGVTDADGWTVPPHHDLIRMWELPLLLLGVGDYDGNYRHLNQAYQQVLGWSAAELKSVPWWEFLHPDERDELTEIAQQLMEHGQVRFEDTVRMLCRNGRYKWVRWNTAIDPERGLFYSAGIDMSDTQECDDWVRVGTWEWHVATDTLTCSLELIDLINLSARPTITGREFLQRVHPEDRVRVELRAGDSRMTGESFAEDFRVIRFDHITRWLHAAGRAVGRRPTRRLRGIALDVTDRRAQGRL